MHLLIFNKTYKFKQKKLLKRYQNNLNENSKRNKFLNLK